MVAGMHRSGTSAVARLMAGLGCDLPKTLMAGDIHNREGYWESQKIADLNDAILASAGSSWDDWEKIDTDWYDSSVVEAFRHRALDTLAVEFGDSPLFVLKDPRICRLLPFWKASLERFGASVRVVVPLREPLEVAASLEARDAIETPFAILIWLRNVLAAEADSRDVSRAFVGYDDLLRNAQAAAERLATKLDIRWPSRSTTARMAMDASLRPTLRHHVKADLSIADNPSAWAGAAFEIFQRWSRDDEHSTDVANLDNMRTMLDDAAAEFAAPIAIGMRSEQNNRVLDDRIAVLDLAVSEKDQLIETLDGHIQERDRLVADRDAKIDEMSGLIGTRDYQIVAAEQRTREHAQTADSLRTALDERTRTIADLETKVDSLNEDVAARDELIDDLSRRAEALNHDVADRDARIDDLNRQAKSLNHEVAARDELIDDLSRRAEALNHDVAARDARIDDLNRRAESLNHEVAARDELIDDLSRRAEALNHDVAARDARIDDLNRRAESLNHEVAARDELIDDLSRRAEALNHDVAARDARIDDLNRQAESLNHEVAARDELIDDLSRRAEALNHDVAARDARIDDLNRQAESLNHEVAARDELIDDLSRNVESAQLALQAIKRSTSWRITKPLRLLKVVLGIVVGLPAKALLRIGAGLLFATMLGFWRLLPLGIDRRQRLRTFLVARMPVRLANRLVSPSPRQVEYMPAQWLDLPDLNYDAANGDSAVPILFDPQFYQQCNEDIGDADATPLQHYMRHGAIEGRLPFAIDAGEIDPTVESLHRLNLASEATSQFDADFYREAYPDVAELDDDGAAKHYENHGRGEGRVGSKGEFVRQVCTSPCEIPLDFNAAEYVRLYPDLAPYSERPTLEALRHYMVSGRREPRLHTLRLGRLDESIDEPEAPALVLDCSSPPLCILAHVYYPELWNELTDYIRNIPEHLYQLHVNLVDTTFSHEFLATIRTSFPTAKVHVSSNFGRDIGGHCQLLQNIDMDEFRCFLLIHTKKSPHLGEGGGYLWRRRLLMPLLGDRRRAVENIALLLADDNVGQIGGSRCRDKKLDHNEIKHRQLLDRLGIADQNEASEFVSGTMMFLRREVLQRVYEAIKYTPFEDGDDKPLAFHVDSQWAHAVERLFGDVVRDLGYRTEWR